MYHMLLQNELKNQEKMEDVGQTVHARGDMDAGRGTIVLLEWDCTHIHRVCCEGAQFMLGVRCVRAFEVDDAGWDHLRLCRSVLVHKLFHCAK